MKFPLKKGQLKTWKDNKGFGFIKPDDGGKEVFLHISALQRRSRRPKVGDTILYNEATESGDKIRATGASIQGDVLQSATKKKRKKGGWLQTIIGSLVLIVSAVFAMESSRSRSPLSITSNTEPAPSPITSIKKPDITKPGCVIKGNISVGTSKKLYHLPGMEDYDSTVIDPAKGEMWFCSESEATKNGWRKAPR